MAVTDSLSGASTTAQVDEVLSRIYGTNLDERPAVSHITALWRQPSGGLRTIRINEHAPKSSLDWFVLNASRARAEAIITTGKILRDEPDLTYTLHGPNELGELLLRWRHEKWGLTDPPWVLVLTGGKNVDFGHPVFRGWARPLIFTSDDGASRYLAHAPCPVVADAAPNLRRAVHHLRQQRRCGLVSIEAGPNTSRTLYDDPIVIDELLLSEFEGASLPEEARGDEFLELDRLRRLLPNESSGAYEEPSGPWRFHRLSR